MRFPADKSWHFGCKRQAILSSPLTKTLTQVKEKEFLISIPERIVLEVVNP